MVSVSPRRRGGCGVAYGGREATARVRGERTFVRRHLCGRPRWPVGSTVRKQATRAGGEGSPIAMIAEMDVHSSAELGRQGLRTRCTRALSPPTTPRTAQCRKTRTNDPAAAASQSREWLPKVTGCFLVPMRFILFRLCQSISNTAAKSQTSRSVSTKVR